MPAIDLERVRRIATDLQHEAGALLPILHAVQAAFGYVPSECVPVIADVLNLSRADVHGVISFYHYFRDTKPGRRTIHLFRAEACQARGQKATEAHAKKALGVDYHGTTADGAFTLEPVYCLGNCAASPAMMIDGELYGDVTPERFDAIVKAPRPAVAPVETAPAKASLLVLNLADVDGTVTVKALAAALASTIAPSAGSKN